MSIDTLYAQPLEVIPEFNVTDDVGANVEAMRLSGLVDDANREATTQAVTENFTALGQLGVAGELVVAIPQWQLPLGRRVTVLDRATKAKYGENHPEPYVDNEIWTPGTVKGSYTDAQLGNLGPEYDSKKWMAHGRLIVPNPNNPDEPILHHLNMPFDGKYAGEDQETQLEAFAKQKAAFEAEHPEANMNPLTARDVSFLALVRLIKGEKMPMQWGFMRDGSLERTEVGGRSIVGDVGSSGSRLLLGRSFGDANPDLGVGVSVGLNELVPQAS